MPSEPPEPPEHPPLAAQPEQLTRHQQGAGLATPGTQQEELEQPTSQGGPARDGESQEFPHQHPKLAPPRQQHEPEGEGDAQGCPDQPRWPDPQLSHYSVRPGLPTAGPGGADPSPTGSDGPNLVPARHDTADPPPAASGGDDPLLPGVMGNVIPSSVGMGDSNPCRPDPLLANPLLIGPSFSNSLARCAPEWRSTAPLYGQPAATRPAAPSLGGPSMTDRLIPCADLVRDPNQGPPIMEGSVPPPELTTPDKPPVSLQQLIEVPGLGAQLLSHVTWLPARVRLRALSRCFRAAVDESLAAQPVLDADALAGVRDVRGALRWLATTCSSVRLLSSRQGPHVSVAEEGDAGEAVAERCGGSGRGSLVKGPPCEAVSQQGGAGTSASGVAVGCCGVAGTGSGAGLYSGVGPGQCVGFYGCCAWLRPVESSAAVPPSPQRSPVAPNDPNVSAGTHNRRLGSGKWDLDDVTLSALSSASASTLEHVHLDKMVLLTGASLTSLASCCHNLKHLSVHRCCGVTDASITAVGRSCPQLRYLNVSECSRVTDASIIEVAGGCRGLMHLDVGVCDFITDASIECIARSCPGLQYLNLGSCHRVSDKSITAVGEACPRLQHLSVWGCAAVTDASISVLAGHCPRLRHLSVWGCTAVTDASVSKVGAACRWLEHVNVHGCLGVTDVSVGIIAGHCEALKHLNVGGCLGVTDASMQLVAGDCRQLQHLDVGGCTGVTDASLSLVAQHSRQLQHLNMWGLDVSDASISMFARNCPQLRHLEVAMCDGMTGCSLRVVAECCDQLQYLDIRGIEVEDSCLQAARAKSVSIRR
eukprot:jgi/Mesvir1/6780/Mv18967-RA.1